MTNRNPRQLILIFAALLAGSALADEPGHRHHNFAPDIDAFHAVLAPVWHARPGPQRTQDACTKADDMARLASEIRSADATPLLASLAALQATCGKDTGGVDSALHDVHDAFHRLIDGGPRAAK